MSIFGKLADAVINFIDPSDNSPNISGNPLDRNVKPSKRIREDLDVPNLFVGKIIDDGNVKCEVLSYEEGNFRIKILEINWPRLGTYMDLDNVYSLLSCYSGKGMQVWEVDPEQMKRDTSQVLLAWEEQCGWTWDLDS